MLITTRIGVSSVFYLFILHLLKESAIDMWAHKCTFKNPVECKTVNAGPLLHSLCGAREGGSWVSLTLRPPFVKWCPRSLWPLWQGHNTVFWMFPFDKNNVVILRWQASCTRYCFLCGSENRNITLEIKKVTFMSQLFFSGAWRCIGSWSDALVE